MFDEVYLRRDLDCSLLAGSLVICDGDSRRKSLVAISQTLDKLVVHELDQLSAVSHSNLLFGRPREEFVYYIAVRDVIKTLAVVSIEGQADSDGNADKLIQFRDSIDDQQAQPQASVGRDLLLIGCSDSLHVYDFQTRSSLLKIHYSATLSALAIVESKPKVPSSSNCSIFAVCGGSQKVSTLRLSTQLGSSFNVSAEFSSEKSVCDDIVCLVKGSLDSQDYIVTGSNEQRIRVYQLDSIDANIRACKLAIEESGRVNCLCPINTLEEHRASISIKEELHRGQSGEQTRGSSREEMNYFAYGLENEIIGVYRLFASSQSAAANQSGKTADSKLATERLWRHRCRQKPAAMLMFDINGDGQDELLIGYKNGRLESRSPLTGQLLAATKCFNNKYDRLVGLAAFDDYSNGPIGSMLIACSTSGSLVWFSKPVNSKPRLPLQGYLSLVGGYHANIQDLETIDEKLHENSDVFMRDATVEPGTMAARPAVNQLVDLHIGPRHAGAAADDAKPTTTLATAATKCEARQNLELLQRINALLNEQMNLEGSARKFYRRNLQQTTRIYPSDINVVHRWDCDSTRLCLKLTIVVATRSESVCLVELEDKSRQIISTGQLLLQPGELIKNPAETGHQDGNSTSTSSSHVIIAFLKSSKNLATCLSLKIFCQLPRGQTDLATSSSDGGHTSMARVHECSIYVPNFSMFSFAQDKNQVIGNSLAESQCLRFAFQLTNEAKLTQVLDWLNESFLCFKFGNLIATDRSKSDIGSACGVRGGFLSEGIASTITNPDSSLMSIIRRHTFAGKADLSVAENFELNLVDLRRLQGDFDSDWLQAAANTSTAADAAGENYLQSNTIEPTRRRQQQATLVTDLQSTPPSNANEKNADGINVKSSLLRLAFSNGWLTIQCSASNSDLVMDLIQSLVIDRLHLELSAERFEKGEFQVYVRPLVSELDSVTRDSRQLEESERRIQSELYESADNIKSLMQQLALANQMNEFSTAIELLNEVSIMLSGAQTSARAHHLNNSSRTELTKRINDLKSKLSFLSGQEL